MFARIKKDRSLHIGRTAAVIAIGVLGWLVAFPISALDWQRSAYALRRSKDFRVRVQAAFALGNAGNTRAVPALERALKDRNPAVRAAAATALGRIAAPRSIKALTRSLRDSSRSVRTQAQRSIDRIKGAPPTRPNRAVAKAQRHGRGFYPAITVVPRVQRVPWHRVRYVVVLGDMHNRSGFAGDSLATYLHNEVADSLGSIRNVAVFRQPEQVDDGALRQIRRRRLPRLRMEGNLVTVDRRNRAREVSVRCEVSLMLLEEPDRNLRGVLSGAATGTEPRSRNRYRQHTRLAQRAVSAAVRSAMASVSHTISRAVHR